MGSYPIAAKKRKKKERKYNKFVMFLKHCEFFVPLSTEDALATNSPNLGD
jgi:hypothetical protein